MTSSKKAPHFGRHVLFPEHNFALEIYTVISTVTETFKAIQMKYKKAISMITLEIPFEHHYLDPVQNIHYRYNIAFHST